MTPAPLPANEATRIAALLSCAVLDTQPEPSFNHIAQLASMLYGTPIALVSLVDESRQWFKARVGLAACETSRDASFCAHANACLEKDRKQRYENVLHLRTELELLRDPPTPSALLP